MRVTLCIKKRKLLTLSSIRESRERKNEQGKNVDLNWLQRPLGHGSISGESATVGEKWLNIAQHGKSWVVSKCWAIPDLDLIMNDRL